VTGIHYISRMDKGSIRQGLLTFACFVAIGLAHYAGPEKGTIVSCAIAYALYLRQPPASGPPPVVKAIAGAILGLSLGHIALASTH
jgi:hypothetical protein